MYLALEDEKCGQMVGLIKKQKKCRHLDRDGQ